MDNLHLQKFQGQVETDNIAAENIRCPKEKEGLLQKYLKSKWCNFISMENQERISFVSII
jgi:hypothetical protein